MPRRTLTADTSWDDICNYLMRVEVALTLAGVGLVLEIWAFCRACVADRAPANLESARLAA